MTPLFLKRRMNKCLLFLLVLTLSNFSFANDSIPSTKFIEECKKSDAYLLHSYTDISYRMSWSRFKKQISVESKLVVNSISGVEKYAFLNLTEFISNHIKEIKVKTLKADGSVIELDSALVFQRKSKGEKFDEINYPIPGVEPGDTIETSYMYTEYVNKSQLLDFVNLYRDVPSLNTEYSVRTNPEVSLRYKSYNGFPEPQVIANDTMTYVLFKMEELKGVEENEYMCIACDLPYMYYSLNPNKDDLRTWKDVYNQEFNAITQPIAFDYEKASYYRKWKRRVIGEAKDSTKYFKFKLLHKNIIDNIKMQPLAKKELFKSSGYFLKEQHFDPMSIRRLYRQLLEDLEIEYSAVFARSKRSGNIDSHYIRMGEYDHIFFAFDNGHGSLSLLYPHDAYFKYQINEIPTSIYNTEAVITKPYLSKKIKRKDKKISYDFKLAEVDSVTTNTIVLPGMSSDHNYIRQVLYKDIDLNNKNDEYKFRFSVSGGLSTEVRSFYDMLHANEEASDFYDALSEFEGNDSGLQVDSITSIHLKNNKPFNYTINAKATVKDAITFVNDSLVSVSLDKLVQHSQIDTEDSSTDLNYYLDYSYTDYYTIMFNFTCDIEILGFENSTIDFKNEYAAYLFNLEVIENNQLKLQSNYKIIKDVIPKEEQHQLEKINQFVKEIRNKRLLIKLKNSDG